VLLNFPAEQVMLMLGAGGPVAGPVTSSSLLLKGSNGTFTFLELKSGFLNLPDPAFVDSPC
jgi:hypothetical protein